MEHMHFKLQTDSKTTIKGTLTYRPTGPRTHFIHLLTAPFAMGTKDFNFHLDDPKDSNSMDLLESLQSICLTQLVQGSTHTA